MIDRVSKKSKQNSENFTKGVIFMIISATGFAFMNIFLRLAGDVPSLQKTFYRNLICFGVSGIVLLFSLKKKPRKLIYHKSDIPWLVLRSIFGTLGTLGLFITVDRIPVAIATVLQKLSPFFTIIFAAMFLKERVSKVQVVGILIAVFGVLVLVRPNTSGQSIDMLMLMVGIGGAVSSSAAYTIVRFLSGRNVDSQLLVCFFAGFAAFSLAPWVLTHHAPMDGTQIMYIFLVGIMGLIGQYGLTYAYKYAAANKISIYDYTNVIITTFLGIVLLEQIPSLLDAAGILIIFLALFILFIYNRNKDEKDTAKVKD